MIRYFVIYTFLISFGRIIKTEQYAKVFTDRGKDYYYITQQEECICDSSDWKYITRQEIKEGVIIMVEFDSLGNK